MRVSRSGAIGLGVALIALVAPATGSAVTTIGSNLATAPGASIINCGPAGGCTIANATLPLSTTAPGGLIAPIDGVVVRWRIRTGATSTSSTTPRIIRVVGATTRTGAGTGTAVTPALNQISTFDTRLPIQAGDRFGVDQAGASATRTPVMGSTFSYWGVPKLADGGPGRNPTASTPDFELLVNADIERDADGDGFGDETQDLCPTNAATQGICPRALSVTVEKGGRATATGIDCPGDCSEVFPQGTTVELTATADEGYGIANLAGVNSCSTRTLKRAVCSVAVFADQTVGVEFGDVEPPQTTVTKQPKKKSDKRKVKFKFRSDEPGKFQCALNKKKFKGYCTSPYKAKVKPGKHVFLVRAVDAGNLVDKSPAKVKFKVTD